MKSKQKDTDILLDRLLTKTFDPLNQYIDKKTDGFKNNKEFSKHILQSLREAKEIKKISLFKLNIQKLILILKESLFSSERAFSNLAFLTLFLAISITISLGLLRRPYSSLQTMISNVMLDSKKHNKPLSKKLIIPSTKEKKLKSNETVLITKRKIEKKVFDAKEEELLIKLELSENESEKLLALKNLKKHYLKKKQKQNLEKINKQIKEIIENKKEKLSN